MQDMKTNKLGEMIYDQLKTVIDPELRINVVDLGFIYEVRVEKKGKIKVLMTLTNPGCPLAGFLKDKVTEKIQDLPGVEEVEVEFCFEPAWTWEMMSDEAKARLGFS